MAIDDKLERTLDRLATSAESDVGGEVIKIAIKMIPLGVGTAIDKLMSGIGQRRLVARIVEVFNEIKSQLDDANDAHVRKEYFSSEEFQTLLALTLQEIQTTHDGKKLEMLASALCNSGRIDFQSEGRKELFVRVLRSLSPEHIKVLHGLTPTIITRKGLLNLADEERELLVTARGKTLQRGQEEMYQTNRFLPVKAFPMIRAPEGEQLLLLQNLASHGLVQETIEQGSKRKSHKIQLREPILVSNRCFRLSTFGEDFLAFVSRKSETSS
jgi:hypothetical protein